MTLRNARLIQILGILVSVLGIMGFWLSRDGAPQTALSSETSALLNPTGESFQASFVVAGRDIKYTQAAGEIIYDEEGNVIGREQAAVGNRYGTNTDTILYVNLVGNNAHIVAIPRDIWLPQYLTKINSMYQYRGAEGLKRAVSELLNVPVDYYAVININVFERAVDAIGGIEVYIPQRMFKVDHAAGLYIDFEEGWRKLDGEDAAKFVRYRSDSTGGDFGRIDRIKTLASSMLERVKQKNVRAALDLPELIDTFFDEVETNVSPTLAAQLAARLSKLRLTTTTLPTSEPTFVTFYDTSTEQDATVSVLLTEPRDIEGFLAEQFGGRERSLVTVPESTLLITNRSGIEGLEDWLKTRLIDFGVPESRIVTRSLPTDPSPTRVLSEQGFWQDANYYASLFHVGQQQVYSIGVHDGTEAGVELVLGQDANALLPARVIAQGGQR